VGMTLAECWELCAERFNCHSFDYRSLSLGKEIVNCELSSFHGADVSRIEFRNCSATPADVRFQCVP
jgi:hypothetical protein